MHTGEATITLQNVEFMFGMVIDGNSVFQKDSRNLEIIGWQQMIYDCTGWRIDEKFFSGVSRIYTASLVQHMNELDEITEESPETMLCSKELDCIYYGCLVGQFFRISLVVNSL